MPRKLQTEEAANILRTVPPENAFYFYKSIGAPTGATARSLPEFLGVLGNADNASLQFHMGRGDFEKWVKMLGDNTLAKQLAVLRERRLREEQLRQLLVDSVRTRINQLQRSTSR
jgi:tryptophan 2,3-dioxygenase